jgi:hypothetical protein
MGIFDLLLDMRNEDIAKQVEAERTNRDGEWVTEWYVEVDGKPIEFDSEQDAYEGANHGHESKPEAEIKIFCVETKRYSREYTDWKPDGG